MKQGRGVRDILLFVALLCPVVRFGFAEEHLARNTCGQASP